MLKLFGSSIRIGLLIAVALYGSANAAEVRELNIATQYGISYLPLMIMEEDQLIKKHAEKAVLGDVKVNWRRFSSGSVMNDALLSGGLDIATGGIPPFLVLWSKTEKTDRAVRGICSLNSLPIFLNTRNASVRDIKDFTEKDKIALPAVKVSAIAIMLQMAAAKSFGIKNYAKLDNLTVSMSHPDGMAALLSEGGEVTSHFTSPPFNFRELENPKVRTVLTAREILEVPVSFNIAYTTEKFRQQNPRLLAAFLAAFKEATDWVNQDKRRAAERYIKLDKSKDSVETIEKMLRHPDTEFTLTPRGVMKTASFMYEVGTIKTKPNSWKDVFIQESHQLPGD